MENIRQLHFVDPGRGGGGLESFMDFKACEDNNTTGIFINCSNIDYRLRVIYSKHFSTFYGSRRRLMGQGEDSMGQGEGSGNKESGDGGRESVWKNER
jgi:hypothetical protein